MQLTGIRRPIELQSMTFKGSNHLNTLSVNFLALVRTFIWNICPKKPLQLPPTWRRCFVCDPKSLLVRIIVFRSLNWPKTAQPGNCTYNYDAVKPLFSCRAHAPHRYFLTFIITSVGLLWVLVLLLRTRIFFHSAGSEVRVPPRNIPEEESHERCRFAPRVMKRKTSHAH